MLQVRPDRRVHRGRSLEREGEIVDCAVLGVPHSGLSEGLRGLLATRFDGVLLVADEPSLLACLDAVRPVLLVLDLDLVPGKGLALTARVRTSHRGLRILLLVADDDPGVATAAEDAGADGCLLKETLGADLLAAVDAVLAGGTAFWSVAGSAFPERPEPALSPVDERKGAR